MAYQNNQNNQNNFLQNRNELMKQVKKTVDSAVNKKIETYKEKGELLFPKNYAYSNALHYAWIKVQGIEVKGGALAVETCDPMSIASSFFEMVVLGLDPTKDQCYFIPKGKQLTLEVSYFGFMAITKRVAGVKEIFAQVIYEDDDIKYEIIGGRITNVKHEQKFSSVNKENITGAYCVIEFEDGTDTAEFMTIDELRDAWSSSKMQKNKNNEGNTHVKFRQEMAKKTVIKRACKKFLKSSDNSDLFVDVAELEQAEERTRKAIVQEEISEHANKNVLSFDDAVAIEAPVEPPVEELEPVYVNRQQAQPQYQEAEFVSVHDIPPHVEQPDMYEEKEALQLFAEPNDNAPF